MCSRNPAGMFLHTTTSESSEISQVGTKPPTVNFSARIKMLRLSSHSAIPLSNVYPFSFPLTLTLRTPLCSVSRSSLRYNLRSIRFSSALSNCASSSMVRNLRRISRMITSGSTSNDIMAWILKSVHHKNSKNGLRGYLPYNKKPKHQNHPPDEIFLFHVFILGKDILFR